MENTKLFIEPGIFFTLPESQIGPDGQNIEYIAKYLQSIHITESTP